MNRADDFIIECRGLGRVFARRRGAPVRAVGGVDLEIQAGEFLVIVGRSGAGKSTLLGLMGGLDQPTSGLVKLEGKALAEVADSELARIRRETIGFIFQDFNLLSAFTALENIEIALAPTSLSRREKRERAMTLLGGFKMLERAGNRPGELSLGEQQRVAVARALANRPKLILADEPTGSVDTITGDFVVGELVELHRKGVTVVVATHGAFRQEVASRVLSMRDGSLEAS